MERNNMMLIWTEQRPNKSGWYWMLSPGQEGNLPTIIQIMFDGMTGRWLALIPPCQDPRNSAKEVELQHVDAMWAGPLELPSVCLLGVNKYQRVSLQEGT